MKDFHLLIWLTQLGFSVAAPLAGFVLGALWLRSRFALGNWVLLIGIGLGFYFAIDGFRICLKAMERVSGMKKQDQKDLPVSFNDHK